MTFLTLSPSCPLHPLVYYAGSCPVCSALSLAAQHRRSSRGGRKTRRLRSVP